jgi:hypothetical protein
MLAILIFAKHEKNLENLEHSQGIQVYIGRKTYMFYGRRTPAPGFVRSKTNSKGRNTSNRYCFIGMSTRTWIESDPTTCVPRLS